MAEKRYYWLKLKKDFFDNLRMKKLRSIAGGDTYTIIYLKMQLLSLQNEGILFYEGVEESFEQEIALLINENVEDVKITINFLISNNLLIQDNNSFELVETKTCIGSETRQAESMRKLRKERNNLLQNGNNVTQMLPNVTKCYTEKEKDIDIEKEKEKEKDIEEITKCYEENIGLMTPATAELLFDYLKDMNKDLILKAIKIASINNKRTGRYVQGILNDWSRKGIKTVLDVEKEQQEFKNKNEIPEETEEERMQRKIKELEAHMQCK